MKRAVSAIALGLISWCLAPVGAHATTTDTQRYVAGAAGACVEGPQPVGPITVPSSDFPGVAQTCFLFDGSPNQLSLSIADVTGQQVLAGWEVYPVDNNINTDPPLASGTFCGSVTIPLPPNAGSVHVTLGNASVVAPVVGPVVGFGPQGNCPAPIAGTVTATY